MNGGQPTGSPGRSVARLVDRRAMVGIVALLLIGGGVLLLAGCRGEVEITNYERPELTVEFGVFENAGCVFDEYGIGNCEEGSPLAELGCDRVRKPSNLLGGLDPAYPMAVCVLYPLAHEEGEGESILQIEEEASFLYREGCMFPSFVRFVIRRDGDFELIRTEDDLRAVFAPVTSEEEALSLAMAARGHSAYYGLEYDPALEYMVDSIEGTNVRQVPGGFRVRLFRYQLCGCGPHNTSAIDLLVSEDGVVERENSFPVFKDPEEDGLCID